MRVTTDFVVSRPRLVSEFTAFAALELYLIPGRPIRMFGCLCMCLFHNNGVFGLNKFGHWCPDGAGKDIAAALQEAGIRPGCVVSCEGTDPMRRSE